MTAEIAVLNSQGVAMAADSAVSIGSSKVYNSANKLFALTKKHPVGVMVSFVMRGRSVVDRQSNVGK
jgi:ATP-dependent protease HslVU (ClpYQ) peptidase subunit